MYVTTLVLANMVVESIFNYTLVGWFSEIPSCLAVNDVLLTLVKYQSAAFQRPGASSRVAGPGWRADDAAEGLDQRRCSPPARLPVGPQPLTDRLTDRPTHTVRRRQGASR